MKVKLKVKADCNMNAEVYKSRGYDSADRLVQGRLCITFSLREQF